MNAVLAQGSYCAVYTSMTDRAHFDATDTFMYPMRSDDVKKTKIEYQDIQKALSAKEPLKLYTVFLQGSASQIHSILSQKERMFKGSRKQTKENMMQNFV